MSPIYAQWMVPLLFFVLTIVYILIKFNMKFNDWLKTYWYKRATLSRQVSFWCFLISLIFLILAVLDWRGPERPVDVKEQKAKVVILIDTSLSMRAEDVRPNRLDKALLIARHIIKSAVNIEFSLMVYSDFTKRISPFTFDTDLLDSRIESLSDLRLSASGSSNTSQAIQEAAQYIQSEGDSNLGSIIVLSDAEVMDQDFPLKIPEKMSVAFVVVSTIQGSVIPLRSESGTLLGNKQYDGQNVISRMDQKVLDHYSSSISNFKYWIASSFSLPTTEILQFISSTAKMGNSSQRLRAREVFQEYFLVPAFLFLIISILLKFFRQWKTIRTISFVGLIFLLGDFFSNKSYGQTAQLAPLASGEKNTSNKKAKKIPEEELAKIQFLQEKWKKKGLEPNEKSALGSLYLKNKIFNKADKVYENQLNQNEIQKSNKNDWYNWGVTKAQNGNPREALNIFKKLLESDVAKNDPELTKKVKESVMSMMQSQAQQKQQQQQDQENQEEQKKDQENQENQEQQQQNQQQQQKNQENQEQQQQDKNNQQQNQQGQDQKQSDEKSKEEFDKHLKDEKEKQDSGNGENKEDKKNEQESDKKNEKEMDSGNEDKIGENHENGKSAPESEKESEPRKSAAQLRKNLSPILKQLINEDRKLQQRLFDASTRERGRQIRKDW